MKSKPLALSLLAFTAAFAFAPSALVFAKKPQNVGHSNGHANESIYANIHASNVVESDNDEAAEDAVSGVSPDGNTGASNCPGFVPPGHFIAPGWLKHHGGIVPTVPSCETLPPGIAAKLGIVATTTPPVSDTTAPSVPAGLVATATSPSAIALGWTASTDNVGVAGYNVFRGGVKIATTTGTAYADTGLAASTTYSYTVSAFDAAGNTSAQSGAASATTFAAVDNVPPSVSLTFPIQSSTISSTITVTASATDNVGVASVQFMLDGNNLGSAVTSSPYSVAWDTKTSADGTHTLTAVARDAAGNTATSAPVSVTVDNTAPTIVAIGTNVTTSSITIAWTTSDPASSQVFYGLTAAYGSSTTLNPTLVTLHSQTITGLAPDTTYHFQVQSADLADNLATSSDGTFTTAALPAITNVTSTAATSTATIDWASNVSTTAILYYTTTLPIDLTSTSTPSVIDSTLASTHSTDLTGLTASTTYYFVIQAADGFGDIVTSTQMSFTTGS